MANAHMFSSGLETHGNAVDNPVVVMERNDSTDKRDNADIANIHDAEIAHESELPEGPTVTRWEEWSYYLYYNGDNGVGPIGYAATQFQNLLNSAGHDPATGEACSTESCVLRFAGKDQSIASIVLIANGISFAIMTVLLTTIGSCADYGSWNKWILIVASVVCWATQYGFLGVTDSSQWNTAMGLYIIGFITYGITLVFFASVFPILARSTKRTKDARQKLDDGLSDSTEYERVEMLERNRLSNISTAHSNWGYLFTMALNLSLLLPSSIANNPNVNNYVLAFTNSYWVVLGLPWFFLQQNRRGPPLPKGEHWLTIGWKQIWNALKQYRRLPFTFIYLFSFFLLADGLNTTGSMVSIVQNDHIQFSFLTSTYLGLAQAATSITSCYAYWYLQKWKAIKTKRMFQVTNVITVFIPFWGMLGLWTNKIGFRNTWEFYAYNVVFGLGQAPYYAYSQTMMSDLTPPGFEGMFFGLFGITNRASSLIGPNVCSAIINRSGNLRDPFIFLFVLCLLAALVITFFVDMEKGRAQAIAFSIEERGMTNEVRVEQVSDVIGAGGLHKRDAEVHHDDQVSHPVIS